MTTGSNEPMIRLEPGGKAPILSYNVPDSTSYSGENIIELQLPATAFTPAASRVPARTQTRTANPDQIKATVTQAMKSGFADARLFPNIRALSDKVRFTEKPNPGLTIATGARVSPKLAQLDADTITSRMQAGQRLNIYRNLYGSYTYTFVPEPTAAAPRLLLVESYRLSSYPGNYGAGRTLKTFTLLPGEKTTISVKSYTKTESDAKTASSILDSFSEESAEEFETSLQSEQSSKENTEKSFEYHAEAEASASWGWGNATVSGGVKGSTNASREDFAKNVSNATEKHAASASSKRDVQVNTSYEVKSESGEETSTVRQIENINVSRTLNFVFRQMNQEYVTVLHLVDVRVAFFNGYAESRKEVSLAELDSLLEEYVLATQRQTAKDMVLDALQTVPDYQDQPHTFIEEKRLVERGNRPSSYWRVKKEYTTKYKDPATGTEFTVPGIIVSARKFVMRTEGIIVEALLGQGDALDAYSHGLQDEAIRTKVLANDLAQRQVKREELAQKVVEGKDQVGAKLFEQVFEVEPEETTSGS
jgi:hypothetical protein